MEAMLGSGTLPTQYYFIREADTNAYSSFTGPVNIGTLSPAGLANLLFIQSSGSSGSYYPITIKNAGGGNLIFTIADNAVMTTGTYNKIGAYGSADYISITGTPSSTNSATIQAVGSDTNVSLNLQTQAAGVIIASAPLQPKAYAISSLPTCSGSVNQGTFAAVNNGVASPTYLATPSTTGSSYQPVFCNGTGWVYH